MVQFNKDSITITVSSSCPQDDFNLILEDMIDLLQSEDELKRKERYYYLELIRAMVVKPI